MKLVCNSCGYERQIGNSVSTYDLEQKCPKCGEDLYITGGDVSFDVKLGGMSSEDIQEIVDKIVKRFSGSIEQLISSLSVTDMLKLAKDYFINKNKK